MACSGLCQHHTFSPPAGEND